MATAADKKPVETKAPAKIDAALSEAAAEKAYAEAAEKVEAKIEAAPEAKPVKVEAKVEAAKAETKTAPKKVVAKKAAAKKAPAAAKAAAKPVEKKVSAKVAPKKAVTKAAKKIAPKKTVKAAPVKAAAKVAPAIQLKDTIMTKTKTAAEDFTAKVKETVTEAQDRAKVAFEKGNALLADAGEFNKANIEALVESGKILAAGVQSLGKDYVAEGKSAFETLTADVKELAAVKSPADFFKLQGEILRRNFDAAVASGSKHSEAIVKLANESFAPISSRVSVAIEKVKQAA
ncbi:MAG TPA: phasin family protein [Novosphingobium sp.]|nr:phasin family protein [Novosphingobium sp.]